MDRVFTHIANVIAHLLGHLASFLISSLLVVVWAASGPIMDYSDTWQLIINIATTVLTFLAVFLIQNSQNRTVPPCRLNWMRSCPHLKNARSEFVGIEHLTDAQIGAI